MNDDQVLRDFVAKYARPYDPESDDYDRPPFAADIKEGKNDPIYNAHSYLTKVPPRGIIPYILHYTKPGDLILDPFHRGARLSEHDCRQLLERHVGQEAAFDPALLAPATKPQMLTRTLLNLKRIYVRLHSFPQARSVTELLLAVDPPGLAELRDRGLLAYHMNDFSAALRDLQQYLHFAAGAEVDEEGRSDHEQLWEHVKTLRRRVASLN